MLSLDRCTKSVVLQGTKQINATTTVVLQAFIWVSLFQGLKITSGYISLLIMIFSERMVFSSHSKKNISISINQGLSQISISYFGEIKHGMHKSIKNKNKKYTSEEIDLSPS